MQDQSGTVHACEYDKLGRLMRDQVTALGTDIGGSVARIVGVPGIVYGIRSAGR